MNRDQKSTVVSELKSKVVGSNLVVVAHYRGLTDKQLYDMRLSLKSKDCGMKIAKNTLVRLAVKGTELEAITSHLKGPTAILYSQDPVALSKVVSDTLKQAEALKFQVGFMDKALVSESTVQNLAKLGSLDEVRAAFIGRLRAVQSNFVRVVKAPSEGMASTFSS
jgi:large subunit ribosomal protein L10